MKSTTFTVEHKRGIGVRDAADVFVLRSRARSRYYLPVRWTWLALLVACGGSHSSTPDVRSDVPGDEGGPDTGCPAPKMTCSSACIDTNTDPMHCGDCTTMCDPGQSCAGGSCFMPHATTSVLHYGGPDFGNFVEAIAVDAAGNFYIAGAFVGTIDVGAGQMVASGPQDWLVASLTPAGTLRWAKQFGGAQLDQAAGITVDTHGHVFVIGNFEASVDFGGGMLTSAGYDDIAIVTLAQDTGAYVDARRLGTTSGEDGLGIVVDASGNQTICGFFGAGTLDLGGGASLIGAAGDNAFVASFDSTGAHRWSRMLGAGTTGNLSSCQSIALDASGGVVTTGSFDGSVDFGAGTVTGNADIFVAAYTATGTPRWSHHYGGSNYDQGYSIAIAGNGDVMVGGHTYGQVDFGTGTVGTSGTSDGFLLQLDSGGTTRFARVLGGSGQVRAVRADPSGLLVATGALVGATDLGTGTLAPIGPADIFVAAFGLDGNATYARRLGGTDYSEGDSLAISSGGALAVGGEFRGTADLGTGSIAGGARDNGFVMLLAP
jgi:hypothetical protein